MTAVFDLIGIGASTLDILTAVEDFPTGRAVHEARAVKMEGGGPVATALAAAAKLGAACQMLDELGDDAAGRAICADFQTYGVDTRALHFLPGAASAVASILVNQKGERAVYFQRGGTEDLSPAARNGILSRIPYASVLHINGRHMGILEEAMRTARAAGVCISFDGGADRYRSEMRTLAEQADICIVARDFAEKHTGCTDCAEMVRALFTSHTKIAGVTDGVRGSWLMERGGEVIHQRACQMAHVIDTTGCGDSYHGAFLYALTRGKTVSEAARLAAAVAAMNTQALGGRSALPNRKELDAFLRERA